MTLEHSAALDPENSCHNEADPDLDDDARLDPANLLAEPHLLLCYKIIMLLVIVPCLLRFLFSA